jgi:predicted HTH transcriptional regulator
MSSIDKEHPQYLDEPESRRLEFKERLPKGNQLSRTAVAFANGAGGKIVLGVKDSPREIIGISENKLFTLEERINSSIFDQCTPAIVPEVYIQSAAEKTLLVVEIFPGSNKPYYIKKRGKHNGTYVRIGSSNRKASLEMIEELERRRRKVSFDSLPVYDLSPDEIDLKRFERAFKERSGKRLKGDLIKNLGLFHTERDRSYPKNAAILLSDSQARKQYLPYAKIECARFKGSERRVFLDQATIDEPIFASIEPCMTFIKKNIALGSTIGEIYREDRWEYPMEAIREALINAVIHRDYSILGSDIKVAIYDDMLEITSPGPLPDLLSLEELGTGRSEIRNRVLAPIFKDMKLIEAWGSGIQKMKTDLKDYPEIDLALIEAGHTFQVQFVKKEKVKAESGPGQGRVRAESGQSRGRVKAESQPESMQGRILEAFASGPLSKAEISDSLGMKRVTGYLNRIVRELLSEGQIEFTIPEKPNSRLQKYRLIDKKKKDK